MWCRTVDVIDFDDFDSGEEADDEQLLNRMKRPKHIRKEYKGCGNIKDYEFYVEQEFGRRKQVTERVRLLSLESRRALKVVKCDHERVRANFYGTVVGYVKGKGGPKEVICSPTRSINNPSTSKDKGKIGKPKTIRARKVRV